jgi:hypothetical protein
MDTNVTVILQIVAWALPKVFAHLGILKQLDTLAEQEGASVSIRAFLRAKIAERQALAEAEAQ